VLMPMGCDFRWRNASLSFDAIECGIMLNVLLSHAPCN
jgi:hypothetical protein